MTDPIISNATSGSIVTALQGQSQTSPYVIVYEVHLSDIGGPGEDKLFFHDGRNGTSDIEWYSLINEKDFGSSNASHYRRVTYTALPMESEGWEVRGTGTLPRPTVRMANVNSYWSGYLTNFDDLVGAKVVRRRTLEKYLYHKEASAGDNNPPVEFNRDVFYIDRKTTESASQVEFELASAFDVEGIKLPRRSIIAARCPWKYKDTSQGGCNWPADNRYTPVGGSETVLYFDKDDNRITVDTASTGAYEYTYWGRQDLENNRTGNLYATASYTIGNYVEYQRPLGSLYKITKLQRMSANVVELTFETSAEAVQFTTGTGTSATSDDDWLVLKSLSTAAANHKNVPLRVTVSGAGGKVRVQTDDSHTATIGDASASIGYVQACRPTLYKCTVAHGIATGDASDDLIKPTNISYWEIGDICGKRLNSCAIRFGHVTTGQVDLIHIQDLTVGTNKVLQQGSGYANGEATAIVTIDAPTGDDPVTATATAQVVGGKVISFAMVNKGRGYEANPTVTLGGTGSGAVAEAKVRYQTTDNVNLPFGGFPGAALY